MNFRSILCLRVASGLLALVSCSSANAWQPLRVHPQNPYVIEFREQPAVLRTYGEHYSSVINSNFDFIPYLNVLQRDGMNLTRALLLGFRLADSDPFPNSPLHATPASFLQPWQRSGTSGNALDGLGKWDFSTWNEDYFVRLNAFAQACSDRGIAIEFTLFCLQYNDPQWQTSPFNPANNLQGVGSTNRYDSLRLVDANLQAAQEAAVRRIVREMNRFDNIFYEVENEPFWNDPGIKDAQDVEFQNRMLTVIRDEESRLPNRHLVAHNFPQQVNAMSGDFDIINEHYPAAVPGTAVAGAEALLRDHYQRGRILSLDETDTTSPTQSRLESWMFILGGGGIYNGLDLPNNSYTEQDESGDTPFGNACRSAIRNLGTYLNNLRLLTLRRNLSWVTGGLPSGATLQAMSEPGRQYVAYLHHGRSSLTAWQLSYNPIDSNSHTASLVVTLPQGTWRAVWTRPVDLVELGSEVFTHAGGARTLAAVTYQEDAALRIESVAAGANTAPVANPETCATNQNSPLTVPAAGVLANDTDAQSNPLAAVLNAGPGHGALALKANGGFTYTPAGGYTGNDSFTYHANDGSLNSSAVTVGITVNPGVTAGLVNGGFESGYTGWAWSGNLQVYSPTPVTSAEGIRHVVFSSDNSAPNGVLSQTFATTPGQAYLVSFQVGVLSSNTSEQRLQAEVTGGTAPASKTISVFGAGGGGTVWSANSLAFTAASNGATLFFRDLSPTTASLDLLLDDVRVENDVFTPPSDPTALPTPTFTRTPGVLYITTVTPLAGTYELQRSADLVHWTHVEEIVLPAPGPLPFTDTATSDPRVFYRIVTKP